MLARTLGLVVALALMAFATRSARLSAFEQHQNAQRYEDVYYLPPADWLPAMSLGYESALADLLWCRALVYFGEDLGARGAGRHIFQYADAILTLAPDFRAAYRWASTVIIYKVTPATLEEMQRGADYLRRAVQRWPDDGELRWDLGSYLRFEIAPHIKDDPNAKDRVLEEATMHLHVAGLKGAGPPWLALNNSTLLTRIGKKELAIRQLEEVYATVDDDATRADILIRLGELRSETYAAAIQAAWAAFETDRRQNFPYLSPHLFLLVGPKVANGYDQALAEGFIPDDTFVDETEDSAP